MKTIATIRSKTILAIKLAPPTSKPSTASMPAIISALSGLTLPPYRILTLAFRRAGERNQAFADVAVRFANLFGVALSPVPIAHTGS